MDIGSAIGIALDLEATIDLGRIDAVVATVSPAVVAIAMRRLGSRDRQDRKARQAQRIAPPEHGRIAPQE